MGGYHLQEALYNTIHYPDRKPPTPIGIIILIKNQEHETNLLDRETSHILFADTAPFTCHF